MNKILQGFGWASLVAQMVKNPPMLWETWVRSLGWEDPLEKGTTTHSSILAWRIPGTKEPGRLQSMGSWGVRHNWATFTQGLSYAAGNWCRETTPKHLTQWLPQLKNSNAAASLIPISDLYSLSTRYGRLLTPYIYIGFKIILLVYVFGCPGSLLLWLGSPPVAVCRRYS